MERKYLKRKPKTLDGYIVITHHEEELMISILGILYLSADGQYTVIHLKNRRPVISTDNLKVFEALLMELQFCRIHRSSIVNLAEVKTYIRARGGQVELSDGTQLNVSQRKKATFRKAWRTCADNSRMMLVKAGTRTAVQPSDNFKSSLAS